MCFHTAHRRQETALHTDHTSHIAGKHCPDCTASRDTPAAVRVRHPQMRCLRLQCQFVILVDVMVRARERWRVQESERERAASRREQQQRKVQEERGQSKVAGAEGAAAEANYNTSSSGTLAALDAHCGAAGGTPGRTTLHQACQPSPARVRATRDRLNPSVCHLLLLHLWCQVEAQAARVCRHAAGSRRPVAAMA